MNPTQPSLINTLGKKTISSYGTLTRENLLKSFPQETLSKTWHSLSLFVSQNYSSGKGTTIKGFGTFTFTSANVSLEGTTNQYERDHRLRKPVFIVSSEFNEHLRPGQYNVSNGLIYYNQKLNNSISHIRLNYAELAFAIGITKDECVTLITTLFKYMSESIQRGEFKNKDMPTVGTLMLRNNVFGVKFNNELIESCKGVPQKLIQTKKDIQLYMQPDESKVIPVKDIKDVAKTMKMLRPKTAVVTKVSQNGEKWLKDNLGIDLNEIDNDNDNTSGNVVNKKGTYRSDLHFVNNRNEVGFINDIPQSSSLHPFNDMKVFTLRDLNVPVKVLEAILYHKSFIIAEMKAFDKRNTGSITKNECVRAFAKANAHYALTSQTVNDIMKVYARNVDNVDYMKLMTCLLRDIKSICKKNDTNTARSYGIDNKTSYKQLRPMSASVNNNSNTLGAYRIKDNITSQNVKLNEVINEIKSIKLILPDLLYKHRTSLDQQISSNELWLKLKEYSIAYPHSKIQQILTFIDIPSLSSFTLNEFNTHITKCKITSSEMSHNDIITTFHKIKDIIYAYGGKSFLFPPPSTSISLSNFISKLSSTSFSPDALSSVFHYVTKSSRELTIADYDAFFVESASTFTEDFFINAINAINRVIQRSQLKPNEYFSHMLSYNISRDANTIQRVDFHRICLVKKLKYSAEELDHIFNYIDLKKDGVIDRNEFVTSVQKVFGALYQIQDVIKKECLDIEDIAFRLDIADVNSNDKLDYYAFKNKIKKIDYTYSDEYIQALFKEIKQEGKTYVVVKDMLNKFNVYHKDNFNEINNESFKKNFIANIKDVAEYAQLKKSFEYIDSHHNGRLTKADFCSIIQKYSNEFKDAEIMKFTRICGLVDAANLVKYTEFLNMIYYNAKDDLFTKCIDVIKENIITQCNRNLKQFFMNISGNAQSLTLSQLKQFLMNSIIDDNNNNEKINNVICKFDLDSDGVISIEDMKGIFERYVSTSFFKYENTAISPETNLYANDTISEEKFKSIVREIKSNMKKKNITEVGLFKKLDINGDGFISNYEFNSRIDDVIVLAPAIKDQVFNYLDYYHNGLVDMETFLKRLKEFKSNDVLIKNNSTFENEVISALCEWIKVNVTSLSDSEIFNIIDCDCDGKVSLNDLKQFCINELSFSPQELNDYKLQRVVQSISLTKNNNICFADIKEIINKSCASKDEFVDFKEKFKETINQNLSKVKTSNVNDNNVEWVNDIIEKFGMFISERYDSIEMFFNKNTSVNSNKFTIDDFIRFHKTNYECFDGFNLTRDELLAVFTTLDSHKKNYLTIDDFNNKLKMFDFYKKMHFDIKNFIQQNFNNSSDAFKYINTDNSSNINTKQMFNAINKFFPNKYLTETILKYINKMFIHNETIPFSEFNYVYFDTIRNDAQYEQSKNNKTLLSTTRKRPQSAVSNTKRNNEYCNCELTSKLQTPYDYDALTKLKRIIDSSNFDYKSYFTKYKSVAQDGFINKYEFRNIIKALNIGLTHLEIEDIISKVGMTRDGKVNFTEFLTFIFSQDKHIVTSNKNIALFISDMKELIYKYYSTPKLAFQFNDLNKNDVLDFNEYKNMICDLYIKEKRSEPNFAQLKNSFDVLDLRKDGIIDVNEWDKAFVDYESKLDVKGKNPQKMKQLRQWENSGDLQGIYGEIMRNRKMLKDKAKRYFFNDGSGCSMIQCDNLIAALKEVLPRVSLSSTQWKMMVLVGDKNRSGMVDYEMFMKIVETSAKRSVGQPRFK